MDTSKEYIEMCAAAQEVQEYCIRRSPNSMATKEVRYHLHPGDFYFGPSVKEVFVFEEGGVGSFNSVWIPRMDQLTEIMRKKPQGLLTLIGEIYITLKAIGDESIGSPEQLFLNILMRVIYKKQYDKFTGQWVAIGFTIKIKEDEKIF